MSARRKYDTKTEWQVLSSICNSRYPERRFKYYGLVNIEHFGHAETREVYSRISAHLERGAAQVPSFDVLADDPKLSLRSRTPLQSRIDPYRSEADFTVALESLVSHAKTRELYKMFEALHKTLNDDEAGSDYSELEGKIESSLFKLRANVSEEKIIHGKAGSKEMMSLAKEALTFANNGRRFRTGWQEFDELTGGLEPGNVMLLTANTGGGKSVAALSMFANMYRGYGYNLTYVSLEMTDREVMERLLSNATGAEYSRMRAGNWSTRERADILKQFEDRFLNTSQGRCSIYSPKDDYTIEQILTQIQGQPNDVIFIDYLGLLKPGTYGGKQATEEFQLRQATRVAKRMAEKLGCAIVLLAQLNDEGQIMYSKGIGHHVHYWLKWMCKEEDIDRGFVTIEMGKSRNSRKKDLYCTTDFDHMRMDNVANPPGLEEYKAALASTGDKRVQRKPGDNGPPGKRPPPPPPKAPRAQIPLYDEQL